MRKIAVAAMVSMFLLSTVGAYAAVVSDTVQPTVPHTEKTKDRASRAMNNIFYGPVETPANIDETKTKGAKIDGCGEKTKDGVARGIARIVGGVWQLATFWYSDPGCVTSTEPAAPKTASVK